MSKRDWSLSRREALKAFGLAAGAAGLPLGAERAFAQGGGRVVVGTWGGDYARLLAKNIEDPLLKPKGYEVVQDQAGDAPRRAKMLAERRLPRGTSDIQGLSAANMYEMNEAGVIEQIDYGKLPNAANLLPQMKYPYGVGHIYSGKVAVYNPKLINPAPTNFKDVFDPKHGNKHGIIDIQYQYVMAAAALAAGGKVSDFEPGKALLLEAKKAGVRVYPTNEAFAQALKNEEIGIGVMWKARVVQWQNAGISVESVAPAEGLPMYVSGFAIPKNAPNKEGAYAYMNAMLDKGAQENFAIDMGYNPTVTGATVAPDLQKRIGFTAEEQKRLVDLDYGYIAKNDQALKEWWDKVFKA
jgi:putative spermidine/putrescine transport system substrate-binding protein